MKFCYVDESGTGDEPYAVMAGVLVDAYRMRPTKEDWNTLLSGLARIVGREVKEFHTRDFYAGNSPWRDIKGPDRAAVLTAIFDWYAARGHHIVYSIVDKEKFEKLFDDHEYSDSVGTLWRTMALHIALSLQKNNQKIKNNKGNTVMIFDSHEKDEKDYSELILSPPDWTDMYYARKKRQTKMDQIIDVPHFVDSSYVGMIQLADCISYFLRRHIEISEEKIPQKYEGESEIVSRWAGCILRRSIPKGCIYPQRGRCDADEFFCQFAPDSIL